MGSLSRKGTPVVPVVNPSPREIVDGINRALRGLLNNIASVSLKKDAVSTTISDQLAGPDSLILPMPTSVDGATALNTWRVSTQTDGSFVMSHVSTSTSDATIRYAIFG